MAYGSDIAGVLDVDPTLSVVTGLRALATSILRRLFTPRGGLIGSPTYGYDVSSLIGSSTPAAIIEQKVLEQVLAEEEVEDASVSVRLTGSTLTIQIHVIAGEGPFDLTIDQSEVRTALFFNNELLEAA